MTTPGQSGQDGEVLSVPALPAPRPALEAGPASMFRELMEQPTTVPTPPARTADREVEPAPAWPSAVQASPTGPASSAPAGTAAPHTVLPASSPAPRPRGRLRLLLLLLLLLVVAAAGAVTGGYALGSDGSEVEAPAPVEAPSVP